MNAVARALEDDVFQQGERSVDKQTAVEKQRLYSRVGQFLMGSFHDHWWCRYPTLMTFMMRILELHPGPDSVRAFYERMALQLGLCSKCVDIYHSSLPSVRAELECEFTPTSVKDFFQKLSQLDAERIQSMFAPKVAQPTSTSTSATTLTTALYEVLSYRRLWSDFRIIRVISKWLSSTPEAVKETIIVDLLRQCPGVFQWLVSPDPGIRAWATAIVGKFGTIDFSAEKHEDKQCLEVLDEWMFILESGSFNVSLLTLGLPSMEDLPMFLDASNCVKTPTNQILWAALDTVMQRMDGNSLETMLESFDNLPDLVFNYLNDADPASTNPQIVFVICKCYGSLIKCLGHRYWNHTVHSPKVVLDMIIGHCKLPSWRVFVTKQLIEALPPLLASMRPPSTTRSGSNKSKVDGYFAGRERVLMLFMHQQERPSHFNEQVLSVAVSKAVSSIICDCYEPRLLFVKDLGRDVERKRDDGALPELSLVDYSVSEGAHWWPCGPTFQEIEHMWMNHLFLLLINPENVASLVDHVATTCVIVLSKHLTLARDTVFSSILGSSSSSRALPNKPIITRLLERLCGWNSIATIPIAVHGALFESIGCIAEILSVMASATELDGSLRDLKATLIKYETLMGLYLQRISDEVLVKGLSNALRFPVVAQHISICLLSQNSQVAQNFKRLLANAAANKATPDRIPSPLEAFLVVVHRNTEAFLRGVLNLMQSLKVYDFSLRVSLPTVKKIVFVWTKVFEMLGNDIRKAIAWKVNEAQSTTAWGLDNGANLQKVPVFVADFVVQLTIQLYENERVIPVEESVLIQCLDFGIAFWKFLSVEKDTLASSKRFSGLISPLVKCIEGSGGPAEKRRAAEWLMMVLEVFHSGQTRIEDAALHKLESIKGSSTVESRISTDFGRMAQKLRKVTKSTRFFSPRIEKSRRTSPKSVDLASPSDKAPTWHDSAEGSSRPMSAKAAAREQARLAMARSAGSTIFESAPKQAHSFYTEDDTITSAKKPVKKSTGPEDVTQKPSFSIAQVVKGMSHSHVATSSGRRALTRTENERKEDAGDDDGEDEDENTLNLAALFFKIKHTQKPTPMCSLLPFYRHLLQICMPTLLMKEFENERSDRELSVPPLTFKKCSEYVNAFLPLLLEECHNEVQEGLRRCYFSAQKNGHLLRYESEKPREGMRCISLSVVENVNTSADKRPGDRFFRREKLFRNADVVLLRSTGSRQHLGPMDFVGVVVISETERGKRRQGSSQPGNKDEEELIKVLFLNDGELESVTGEIPSFKMEVLTASAIADTEWRVTTIGNLVTSSREYVALRSVDTLPGHLRTTILTPNMYKTTQTELLTITTLIDELRAMKHCEESASKILKLLKRLDKMDITLTDLRSTGIGKSINRLRKHENTGISSLSNQLKDKWTALMEQKDALAAAPRYVSGPLWGAIKSQYNQSQLQSIHSVLNNYSAGVSLLQGPPGTGKTKTIMGLLSGFLSMKVPAMAMRPSPKARSIEDKAEDQVFATKASEPQVSVSATGSFNNFSLVREIASKQGSGSLPVFSLNGGSSSKILRRNDHEATGPKPSTIQALKNTGSVRSRLENKLSSRGLSQSASSNLVRRTLLAPSVIMSGSRGASSRGANVLLCAPSNGAVDELVLRIVTDGLMDSEGKPTKVRAPSVHPDSSVNWLSVVRLGNPGEDAPEVVKAVCLPHIIKQELEIHPKTLELRSLQARQRALRNSIRDFHDKKNNAGEGAPVEKGARRGLAKMHGELTECSGKVRRLRDEVSSLEAKMTAAILSRASIIACTLSKAGSGTFSGLQRGFDALIVDEAAQAVELSTLVPVRERVARVVLVGDPKQLPATVKSVVAANARFDRSLFERIADSGVAPSMLRVQYRMHPFLREFPSKRFYGGMLTDGASVMERVQRVCGDVYKHPCFQPFLVYDLFDTKEDNFNGSKYNKMEAAFCVELCKTMFDTYPDLRVKKWSVGFVSPYKEQVRVIRQEINRSTIPTSLSIEVNTVDGFQGREKDVIIFSCVRASDRGGIGFLKDIRRLNVAITRARFCLFVVGNVRTLRRDETWNALVESARERKLIIRAKSTDLAGVMQDMTANDCGLRVHYEQMHDKLNKKSASVSLGVDKESPNNKDASSAGKQVKKSGMEKNRSKPDPFGATCDGALAASVVAKGTNGSISAVASEASNSLADDIVTGCAVRSDRVAVHELGHRSRTPAANKDSGSEHETGEAPSERDPSRHRTSIREKRVASMDSLPNELKRSAPQDREHGPSKSRRVSPESNASHSNHADSHHRTKHRPRTDTCDVHRDYRRSDQHEIDSSESSLQKRRQENDPREKKFEAPSRQPASSDKRSLSSLEQQHRDRQERLKALRNGADPNSLSSRFVTSGQAPSQSAARIVQQVRTNSRDDSGISSNSNHIRPRDTQRSSGGGLLGSILGSTSQLASATSRIHNKSTARRDHI